MKIEVRVRPNTTKESVGKLSEGIYKVSVTAPPKENEANHAVMVLMAKYFSVPLSRVRLVGGRTSRHKTLVIDKETNA